MTPTYSLRRYRYRSPLSRLRMASAAVAALAVAFFAFFQLTKQLPAFALVNPAAHDPYDAIGSFGVQLALMLGAASLLRVWWPRQSPLTPERITSITRMQMAVLAAIELTLLADFIALVRHIDMWSHSSAGVAFLVGLLALDGTNTLLGSRILKSGQGRLPAPETAQVMRALASVTALAGVLAIYPESATTTLPGALATIVVGMVLLFVPVAEASLALVPYSHNRAREALELPEVLQPAVAQWALLIAGGLVAGLLLLLAEALAGGGLQSPLLVTGVYLGMETLAAVVGFALLRGPLGLRRF